MRRRDREVSELEGIRQILDRSKVIHVGMHDGDDIYILPRIQELPCHHWCSGLLYGYHGILPG